VHTRSIGALGLNFKHKQLNNKAMYIDQKVTIWTRLTLNCNDDEIERIKNEILKHLEEGKNQDDIANMYHDQVEFETLYDTSEAITVNENGGCGTVEFYGDEGELLFENSKTN